MKIIIDGIERINALVAEEIDALVRENPTAAIAFAAGRTQEGLFKTLAESRKADYSGVQVFALAEYMDCPDFEKSAQHYLEEKLCKRLGIKSLHLPSAEEPEEYDEKIASCGGLKLAVLGIGTNGHIGYNEPATLFDTQTHIAKLTDKTRAMRAESFGGMENVPTQAVTMGLKTICSAKKVILCAFGEEKAQIVHSLVYGKTSTYVPAAMLQMHSDMSLYLDSAAAGKLD